MITEEDDDSSVGNVGTRIAKRKREQQEDEADYLILEDSNDGTGAPAAKRARTEAPQQFVANNNTNVNNKGAGGEKKEKTKKLNRSLRPIWKAVKKAKDETGRARSKIFMDLPSRALYPDYYQVRPYQYLVLVSYTYVIYG